MKRKRNRRYQFKKKFVKTIERLIIRRLILLSKGKEWYNESEERMVALRQFIPCEYNSKTIVLRNNKKHIKVDIPVSCLKMIIIGPISDSDSIIKVRDAAEKIDIQYNNVIIPDCPLQ